MGASCSTIAQAWIDTTRTVNVATADDHLERRVFILADRKIDV